MSSESWKKLLALLWLCGFLGIFLLWILSDIPLRETPRYLEEVLRQVGIYQAALCYILLYTIRPLILFPATLLTISSGLLFGPWLGILFTIVGENASANFAFLVARWFGRDWVKKRESLKMQAWQQRLSANGIVTVLIMRLLMLPFDAVNYSCGLTAMRQRDYAVGTFIGILPALISFVLLGGIGAAGVQNRYALFGFSLLFLLAGLLVAKLLARRGGNTPEQDLVDPEQY